MYEDQVRPGVCVVFGITFGARVRKGHQQREWGADWARGDYGAAVMPQSFRDSFAEVVAGVDRGKTGREIATTSMRLWSWATKE
jgi:hypothetical protein